ncbi:MAG: glycosyltransferase family 2 protein [Acidimicrobiia bacterium]
MTAIGQSEPRTLVIVPALNEEEALPATLKEVRTAVPYADIVVVDDGSRDATARVAREGGAVAVVLPYNLGVGGAVRTGLRYASQHEYDRAVVVDADGQHDPSGITALLDALARADLVIGSRFADGAPVYDVGRVRRRAMRLLQRIVRVLTGQRFTDVTSGFRALDRPVIELLARDYPAEYLADTVEALLIVNHAGFRVTEVPIAMRVRAGGVPSSRGLGLVVNYLRVLIGILSSGSRRDRKPPVRASEPPMEESS